jgi:hypothetical protein
MGSRPWLIHCKAWEMQLKTRELALQGWGEWGANSKDVGPLGSRFGELQRSELSCSSPRQFQCCWCWRQRRSTWSNVTVKFCWSEGYGDRRVSAGDQEWGQDRGRCMYH